MKKICPNGLPPLHVTLQPNIGEKAVLKEGMNPQVSGVGGSRPTLVNG